jgi:hypothetical protein
MLVTLIILKAWVEEEMLILEIDWLLDRMADVRTEIRR